MGSAKCNTGKQTLQFIKALADTDAVIGGDLWLGIPTKVRLFVEFMQEELNSVSYFLDRSVQ